MVNNLSARYYKKKQQQQQQRKATKKGLQKTSVFLFQMNVSDFFLLKELVVFWKSI